ncbi:hypothetical protein Tco_1109203 [Tanacetum coccineum]
MLEPASTLTSPRMSLSLQSSLMDICLSTRKVSISDDDNTKNGFKHSEPSSVNCSTEARSALSNLTDSTKDTTLVSVSDDDNAENGFKHSEPSSVSTEARSALSNLTHPTKDTTPDIDKENCYTTKERAVSVPSRAGQSKEVSDTLFSPSGRPEKADVGGKTSEATNRLKLESRCNL